MNAVIYFSCSGQSKAVAEDLAERLGFAIAEYPVEEREFENAVIVFPVHAQTYPAAMKKFFETLEAQHVTLIATYGRVRYGNALYEAAKLIKGEIVAAAYLPANHTYYEKGETVLAPQEIINKIKAPNPVTIPKLKKTPFAGFMPRLRSRLSVKLKRNENCVSCGICGGLCPIGAIKNGKTNLKCTRCLKCAYGCPHGGLSVRISPILNLYLRKTEYGETVIYV